MGEVGPGKRGLSLGESELGFAANIDHMFRGTLIASISPDNNSIDVEEGYIQTIGAVATASPSRRGASSPASATRTQIHAHAWDFTDAPLANKVFLGNQLDDDGIQFKWVAPTDLYFDVGLELGRGRAVPGRHRRRAQQERLRLGQPVRAPGRRHRREHSPGRRACRTCGPRRRTAPTTDLDSTGTAVTNSFSGRSRLWVAGRHPEMGAQRQCDLHQLQAAGRILPAQRGRHPDLRHARRASLGTQTGGYQLARSRAGTLQGVYQFMPLWRVGYRYDRLDSRHDEHRAGRIAARSAAADFPILGGYNPKRNTLMVDWSPSEFSRVRLQFARDNSRLGADRQPGLPAIHREPGRARRAQVLRRST